VRKVLVAGAVVEVEDSEVSRREEGIVIESLVRTGVEVGSLNVLTATTPITTVARANNTRTPRRLGRR
jgi:hypothetical protein